MRSSWINWVGRKSNEKSLIGRGGDSDTQREEFYVKTEAEVAVMQRRASQLE